MVPMQNRADSGRSLNFTAVRELTIDEQHAGQRIDNFLISRLKGLPRTRIYRILRRGEVRVNKGRIRQHYRLKSGDVVRIPPLRLAQSVASREPARRRPSDHRHGPSFGRHRRDPAGWV